MKRSMMQVYTKKSAAAVALYQKAFNATLGYNVQNEDGSYYHSELDVYGQILSVAEGPDTGAPVTGNTMQFCLHFNPDESAALEQAYNTLREGADVRVPLGPCEFGDSMTDLVDAFGVRWCLFL